jgi:hypothetical protein
VGNVATRGKDHGGEGEVDPSAILAALDVQRRTGGCSGIVARQFDDLESGNTRVARMEADRTWV